MTRHRETATLVRVSRLYYELGETQDAIARALGVTRPQVSKLLKRARAEGIVEIRIVDGTEAPAPIGDELRQRFGLSAVHLAPALADSETLTRRRVGRLGGEVLAGAVRDAMVVGIGDGSSIAAVADGFEDVASPVAATVVPLCGGFWGAPAGREPYRRIADALGATPHGLLAPGLLDDAATRDALAAHAGIRAVAELWERLDIAIFGIGGPAWTEARVGAEALREIEAADAVGEILIAPFDVDGHFLEGPLRDRTIAFEARRLARVPASIGVASGRGKVIPILGALRSGAVKTLVTDVDTATEVLATDARAHGEAPDRRSGTTERV